MQLLVIGVVKPKVFFIPEEVLWLSAVSRDISLVILPTPLRSSEMLRKNAMHFPHHDYSFTRY
jgi:hypothetical protein